MPDDPNFVFAPTVPLDAGGGRGQLPLPGKLALLILHHDRQSERYVLICDHGLTAVEGITGTAEDVEQLVDVLYDKHHGHWDCACLQSDMATLVDEWQDLGLAQRVFADDAVTPIPEISHYQGTQPQMRENSRRLSKLGCTRCKPGVAIMVHKGWYGATLNHAEGCPDPVTREVRFVNRNEPELWGAETVVTPWTVLDGQARLN
jgi:hypothetical protein